MSILATIAIGFFLGIKHSLEPDHVIAVSTIASEPNKRSQALLTGVFWGMGHTATLLITGLLLMGLKINISDKWALTLEMLVGFMLVFLGIKAIQSWNQSTSNKHSYKQIYGKSTIIGITQRDGGTGSLTHFKFKQKNRSSTFFHVLLLFFCLVC